MRFNEAGEVLIKKFEGLCLKPYRCPAGTWTVGWGHTTGITADTPTITPQQAEDLFDQDIATFVGMVSHFVEVDLNDNQFSALVCLTFNVGSGPLQRTLGAKLNNGDFEGAADEFGRWVYSHGVKLPGLITRRYEEKALFMSMDD